MAIDIFVSWDGDSVGRQVGQARLTDDVAEVRRVNAAIDAGNEIWKSFALSVAGQIVEIGGDEGAVQIGADRLPDVPDVARRYADAVGTTVSVGVGTKLSDSSRALLVAKLRGKNRILLWQPSMEAELQVAVSSPQTEAQKLGDEYPQAPLQKTSEDAQGIPAAPMISSPTPPTLDQPEVSAAETPTSLTMVEPEASAPSDYEGFLHQAAADQGRKDGSDEVDEDRERDGLKEQLVQVLTKVREQLPALARLRAEEPDAYAAVMALIQGLVALGRKVAVDPLEVQAQPGELAKSVAKIAPGASSADGASDYSHLLPAAAREQGVSLSVMHAHHVSALTGQKAERLSAEVTHDGRRVGVVTAEIRRKGAGKYIEPHSELESKYRGQGLGQAMYTALYAHAKNVHGVKRVAGDFHSEDHHRMQAALAKKHGFAYKSVRDSPFEEYPYGNFSYTIKSEAASESGMIGPGRGVTFEADDEQGQEQSGANTDASKPSKAGGFTPRAGGAAVLHHLHLPVGTVMSQRVKIRHADGTVAWAAANAGMIASQEPDTPLLGANTHPVSSRRPNS